MKKLNIHIVDNENIEKQIEAVLEYVKKNRVFGTDNEVKQTNNYGQKVFTNKGANHVSCNKTKQGNYTFVVWRAV